MNLTILEKINKIQEADPEFYTVVEELLTHLSNTYNDKYEATKGLLDTKAQLYHPVRGGHINTYQMSRYLQRYLADDSFAKGQNKNDLLKICHYALFDCVRQNRCKAKPKNSDIVDV